MAARAAARAAAYRGGAFGATLARGGLFATAATSRARLLRQPAMRAAWPRALAPRSLATASGPGSGDQDEGLSEAADNLPLNEYHELVDRVFELLEDTFDAHPEVEVAVTSAGGEYDLVLSDGVFTLQMGTFGTWVLNKQAPNKQIWWSSPKSGPKRFNFDAESKSWLTTREPRQELFDLLVGEIKDEVSVDIEVSKEDV